MFPPGDHFASSRLPRRHCFQPYRPQTDHQRRSGRVHISFTGEHVSAEFSGGWYSGSVEKIEIRDAAINSRTIALYKAKRANILLFHRGFLLLPKYRLEEDFQDERSVIRNITELDEVRNKDVVRMNQCRIKGSLVNRHFEVFFQQKYIHLKII